MARLWKVREETMGRSDKGQRLGVQRRRARHRVGRPLGFRARRRQSDCHRLNEALLGELAAVGVAERVKLDVLDGQAVEALAKRLGPVDVLFNAAGFVHHGTILECSDKDWDFSFDLNVKSMHRTIKAFLPGMLEKRKGSIVNIASAVAQKWPPTATVHGDQVRGGGPDARRRLRFRRQRRALQLHLPRHHRDALAGRARQGAGRAGRGRRQGAAHVRRAPAHGQARDGGRDGADRGLSRLRRVLLHHRLGYRRRRRLYPLTTCRGYQRRSEMTETDARRIALDYLKTIERGASCEVELVDRDTIERSFGWIFFYQSKRHLETGNTRCSRRECANCGREGRRSCPRNRDGISVGALSAAIGHNPWLALLDVGEIAQILASPPT